MRKIKTMKNIFQTCWGGALRSSQNSGKIFGLVLVILGAGFFVFGFGTDTQASTASDYWKTYFSSTELTAVQKNAQKYTLAQIKNKSDQWHNVIAGFNIKNGSITDDNIKKNEIATNKIKGLGDFIDEKISGSSTPQDFSAGNLTGTYAALDGSHITGITASQVGAVPYTGATNNLDLGSRTLITTSTGTFGNIKTPIISPSTDSTSAFQINKADGTTNVLNVDTTNGRVGIGTTSPGQQLEITKNFKFPITTSTTGIIYQGNLPIIHTYYEPASDGSNLFVGVNSGNFTMSTGGGSSSLASNNIGFGYGTLHANTTSWRNTAVGISAMQNNTTGDHNIAFGQNALLSNQTGVYNTALGIDALHNGLAASYNVAVGQNALLALDSTGSPSGLYNVAVGYNVASAATSAYDNVVLGAQSMGSLTTGFFNTAVGYGALGGVTTRYSNTALGYHSGPSTSNVLGGVFLGYGAGYYETGNNTLYIDNAQRANTADGRTKALLYGIFDADPANQKLTINGNVGIGTTTPAATLDVNGQVKIQKSSSQPFACDATHDGTIALTSGYRTCACKGGTTTWVFTTDGTTTCTW